MMESHENRNSIYITGMIKQKISVCHEAYGRKFFCGEMNVQRKSTTIDTIPFIVSQDVLPIEWIKDPPKYKVKISGEIRTRNGGQETFPNLQVYVYVNTFELDEDVNESDFSNEVELCGVLCRNPILRITPKGATICEYMIAINRYSSYRSDYIPCIAWYENAHMVSSMHVGDKLLMEGRLQSRSFQKYRTNQLQPDTYTVYEVSAQSVYPLMSIDAQI